MEAFNTLIYIIILLASLIFAIFVFLKNKKAHVNIFFSLYTLSLIGWVVTLFFFYECDQDIILVVGRLNFAIIEITSYLGFYFGYFFPVRTFRLSKIVHIILAVWLVFLNYITMFTDMIDKDEIVTADGVETIFGDYYLIFVLHFIIFVSSIFVIPLCKYKRVNNLQRLQIKYFVFGTVLSIFIGALTNIVLPFAFNIYKLQLLGPLGLFFFFGFTTYAIVKHQLMDIRVIIQRGMIYSALLAVIVGVYIFFVFVLGFFFQQSSDTTVLFAAGLSVVLGIYGVPHLEKVFCKATDKIFFKNKYDYSQAIYELSEILNQNIELNKLLNKTIYKIQEIFKTSFVAIVLPKQNIILNTNESMRQTRELFTLELIKAIEAKNQPILLTEDIPEIANELLIKKANNADIKAINQAHKNAIKYGVEIYVSILLNQKLIGLIILTKKLSGDQYTPEDIKLFKTFSYQAAVALDKAKLFQQVKEYSEELERKVEKRTAKILGLQEEQKKMMQEMAHGLQTPITILKGELTQFNGIVKDNKKVRSIERSIDRVSDFIYGMLRLAKLESETKDGKKEKFNLSKLLNELIESYEIITSEKNIKIDHEIAKHINFFGNEKAIEEMITNLVSNSVKYMKEANDKKISLSLKQDQDSIRLIVADNGIGIDEQDIPKLFQRFYRVGDKEQGKQKGTGLGLAICKEIVQKHNGNIKVESERNKGTKFIITMPIAHF